VPRAATYTLTRTDFAGQTLTVSVGFLPVTVDWPADVDGYYDVIITANISDGVHPPVRGPDRLSRTRTSGASADLSAVRARAFVPHGLRAARGWHADAQNGGGSSRAPRIVRTGQR
jgi:hypothetical protein